jgi:hypothetical protein
VQWRRHGSLNSVPERRSEAACDVSRRRTTRASADQMALILDGKTLSRPMSLYVPLSKGTHLFKIIPYAEK